LVMLYHLEDPEETFELHYFPVTRRLTETVGRLGDFLHRDERLVSDQAAVHREPTNPRERGLRRSADGQFGRAPRPPSA
jgi:hypothetical protein